MPLTKAGMPVLAASAYRKNFIINGGFEVQQRAEVLMTNVDPKYGKSDRWRGSLSSSSPMSMTLTAGAFGGVYTQQALFAAGLQVTAGSFQIAQRIEARDTVKLANKTVTISATLYHDLGASIPFGLVVSRPTSVKDDYGQGTTDVFTSPGFTIGNLIATKISTSFFITEANSLNGLQVSFQPFENLTFVGKTFALAEVQFEIGSVATPFEFRIWEEEFRRCQRFYQTSGSGGSGTVSTATVVWVGLKLPVRMRKNPGVLRLIDNPTIRVKGVATVIASASELSDLFFNSDGGFVTFTGFTGLTVGDGVALLSELIALDAEL